MAPPPELDLSGTPSSIPSRPSYAPHPPDHARFDHLSPGRHAGGAPTIHGWRPPERPISITPARRSTPNATGALRLIGECYPFDPQRPFLLTQDNHNSVNGIGQFAKRAGAAVVRLPVAAPSLRIDRATAAKSLDRAGSSSPGLFAFPAQSDFSDAWRFSRFVQRFLDTTTESMGTEPARRP